jgi:hypothetical protein
VSGQTAGALAALCAAAAKVAVIGPAVAMRPRRNDSTSSMAVTRPAATAASSPLEWAWPPDGNRPSASSSMTVFMEVRKGSTAAPWAVR